MTSEKPSQSWEGFSDVAGRYIFRFAFRRHRISWEAFSSIGKAFRWLVLEFRDLYETLQEYLPEKSLALALLSLILNKYRNCFQ